MEGTEAGPSLQSAVVKRDTCAVCQGFLEQGNPRGEIIIRDKNWYEYIYIHYPSVVVLDQSARNGCQVCSYLVHRFKETAGFAYSWDKAGELERTRVGSFDIDRDTAEAARLAKYFGPNGFKFNSPIYRFVLRVTLTIPKTPQNHSHMLLRHCESFIGYQVGSGHMDTWGRLLNVRADPIDPDPPTQDLLSDAHTHIVHRWMKHCDEKHEKCRLALRQSQKLPKRLLEISSNPATGEITKVRLIETTPSSKGVYVCLSYCWGRSAQYYKTTRSNLLQYLESIPFNNLPGTIIDALKLCCKLGFRYLWVDSLCIIQGDNEDWEREASNMAGIYGSSNLTLAIHLCEDSSESFLQKRQQPEYRFLGETAARIAYTDKRTEEERLIYMWRRDTADVWRSKMGGHVNLTWGRSPWLDRAWTFQEWILSPRVLHIQQITQWECLEGSCNEVLHRFPRENDAEGKDPVHRPRSLLDKNWTWRSIVEEFSRRKIGKDEDRLPALAGLAKQYRDETGFEYLAGLWMQHLPGALLWRKKGRKYLESPADFRAPSWSWASLEGAIHMPSQFESPATGGTWAASIISAECTYWPPDTLSTVRSAWLDIEGPMSLVTKRTIYGDGTISFSNPNILVDEDLYWSVELDQDTCSTEDLAQSKIYLLRIMRSEALVLEKTGQSGGKDTFERRGLAFCGRYRIFSGEHWEKKLIRLV